MATQCSIKMHTVQSLVAETSVSEREAVLRLLRSRPAVHARVMTCKKNILIPIGSALFKNEMLLLTIMIDWSGH